MLRRDRAKALAARRVRREGGPGPGPVVVLVPVLNRPDRAEPLAASLRETSEARLLFLCSPRDGREYRACRAAARRFPNVEMTVVEWRNGPGDYARKINYGVRATQEPWIFQAGDDLRFHEGWEEEALALSDVRRVIGTNDLCNPRVRSGRHSTHTLVAREYVEERGTIDEPGKMLHEGYAHNFVDDEFIGTARSRNEYGFAAASHVEHLHPMRGEVPLDSTYRLGLAGFDADREILRSRRHLWR